MSAKLQLCQFIKLGSVNTIAYISALFVVVPLICGLFVFNRLKQQGLLIFLTYLTGTFLSESITVNLASRKIYTHLLGNIYLLFECVILIIILSYWIYDRVAHWIKLLIALYAVFWIGSMLVLKSTLLNDYSFTLERFILMCLSGYFLLKFMVRTEGQNPFNSAQFWMASGIFIYFTSTIVIFSMAGIYMTGKSARVTNYFSIFNSIINIFSYSIYSIGFLNMLPRRKLNSL